MKIIGANITGSFILNNQDVTTTIQTSNVWSGSVATDITALNAATASLLNYTASNNATITDILLETASLNLVTASLLSYTASQNSRNGTYATTGSNTFAGIQTVNSNLVVTGSITAATLIVQTITSSVDFVTGSTRFGSIAANTHVFTGSMSVTGSVTATSFAGSGANLTSIPNSALNNSTISGISLGSNLATLTIGTGLSGTSYNGSTGVTIACTITNNNQLTNGAGYITSGGSISGTAARISTKDNRTISPSSDNASELRFGFTSWTNNNSAPWADYLHLRSYSDGSGGADNLVMFLKSGIGMRIWQQSFGSGTAYSSYADVLHSSNYNSYAVPLGGGTMTGQLQINTPSNGVGSAFQLYSTSYHQYMSIYSNGSIEAMINYRNDAAQWYVGIRTSSQLVGTSGFHFYNTTSAQTVGGFTIGGSFYTIGSIVASGDVTAYSDARVKTNIKPIDSSLEKVLKLTGVTYNRTDLEDKSTKIGFIAQEVKEVLPEVVSYNEEQDRYGVSYGNVTALLVEAIKEQQTQIEELKTIINALTK
jgi:hypothetical protein